MKVNWRGKERHVIYVGNTAPYAYRTLQSALDSITDAAWDNPYMIVLAAGHTTCEMIMHNKSHVSLVGENKFTSIIERPASDLSGWSGGILSSGGTIEVGCDYVATGDIPNSVTENVTIADLHIVRDQSGAGGGGGGAPEAAIFIGRESKYPGSPAWDNILVENCVIEGVHDGIQYFGCRDTYNVGQPPRLFILRNIIRCSHDASTFKGTQQVYSAHNDIYVTGGLLPPYLTNVGSWKSTGFHMNTSFGTSDQVSTVNPLSGFTSVNDLIRMDSEDWTAIAGSALQAAFAGYYIYYAPGFDPADAPGVDKFPYVKIINTSINLRYSHHGDAQPYGLATDYVGGIVFNLKQAGGLLYDTEDSYTIPRGRYEIQGGDINVENIDPMAFDLPSRVSGINFGVTGISDVSAQPKYLRVVDTKINVINNAATGTALSLLARGYNSTIEARVMSDQAVDTDGGCGIITALTNFVP